MRTYKAFVAITLLAAVGVALAQNKSSEKKATKEAQSGEPEVHEMLLTEGGFLAFNTPKGWERVQGPGMAAFVPEGSDARTSAAMIYISGAPVGADQQDKTRDDYVSSDIVGFKAHFAKGDVRQEKSIRLPESKSDIPVYTFRSGEENNTVEQVAYIQDSPQRVLTVVLSAKSEAAFTKALPVFQAFVKSFQGSIIPAPEQ